MLYSLKIRGTFLRNASAVPEITSVLAEKISIALSRLPNPGRK